MQYIVKHSPYLGTVEGDTVEDAGEGRYRRIKYGPTLLNELVAMGLPEEEVRESLDLGAVGPALRFDPNDLEPIQQDEE